MHLNQSGIIKIECNYFFKNYISYINNLHFNGPIFYFFCHEDKTPIYTAYEAFSFPDTQESSNHACMHALR